MSSEHYPKDMMMLLSKMSNYHTNRFRLETVSASTASSGSVITVNFPESALIDTKSFRWHLRFTGQGAGTGVNEVFAKCPADVQSLINRLELYINGVQVCAINDYNAIYRLMKIERGTLDRDRSFDRVVQNGQINDADADDVLDLICCDWLSFLNESSTRWQPTDLLGQIQVRIGLAGNEVLVPKQFNVALGDPFTGTGQANARNISYQLSNMYFTVDTAVVDASYNELLRQKLSAEGSVKINYKNYYSTSTSLGAASSATTKFSVSSQSIDKLYSTYRKSDFNLVGEAAHAMDNVVGDRFVSNNLRFRSFEDAGSSIAWQFSLNNVAHQQYKAGKLEALADVAYAGVNRVAGPAQRGILCTSVEAFDDGMYCVPLRLNHTNSVCDNCDDVSIMSGYDSRQVNTQLTYEQTGMDSSNDKVNLIVAECLATMDVKLGRQIAIVW